MRKKIIRSTLTRCFLFSILYTVALIIAIEKNEISYLTSTGFWLFVLVPSPLYFAIYGAIRQGIHKKQHRPFISTLIVMATIIITYGMYYIVHSLFQNGIDAFYWRGFVYSPAYVLQHGAIPAVGFCTGSLVVKAVQYLIQRFSKTFNNQTSDNK